MRSDLPQTPAGPGAGRPGADDRPRRHQRGLLPLAVDANGLARLLSSGLRTIRTWDAAGLIPRPHRVGRRVLWNVREIRRWIAAGMPDRQAWEASKTGHESR